MGLFTKSPDIERRRTEGFKKAVERPEYASWSTGPRTKRGALKMASNATRHGAGSSVFALAMAYADAVLEALGQKVPEI